MTPPLDDIPRDPWRLQSPYDGKASGEARCVCNDRALSECPGEWEPGCGLGANEEHARGAPDDESALVDAALGLWVCPWGICNTREAQECRAEMRTTKFRRGCGTYFPQGITPEQAKQMIGKGATPEVIVEPDAFAWHYPDGRPCTLTWTGQEGARVSGWAASRGLVRRELYGAPPTDDFPTKLREALAAGALRAALERLVRVVRDLEWADQQERPTDEELAEALAVAEAALKLATGAK